jgi:hypothetical protein
MSQIRSDSGSSRVQKGPASRAGRWRRLAAGIALLAILAPAPALAERGDFLQAPAVRKTWDLVALRPFDLIQLGVSAGFFVLAWPVTLVTGGGDFVREVCITLPVERTFRRPLGEL